MFRKFCPWYVSFFFFFWGGGGGGGGGGKEKGDKTAALCQ